MSTITSLSQTVRFPSEEAINAYAETYTMTATGDAVNLYIPGLFRLLATHFAHKEISLDVLEDKVLQAVNQAIDTHGTTEQKKQKELHAWAKTINASLDKRGCVDLEYIRLEYDAIPPLMRTTIDICAKLMKDVLNQAA